MPEEERHPSKTVRPREGHQPTRKGYQPAQGHLDPSKPPQGGSGVSTDTSSGSDSEQADNKSK